LTEATISPKTKDRKLKTENHFMSELLQYIGSIALLIIVLFALAIIIHFVTAWRRKRRDNEPPPE
jgi:hypothetical protein